MATALGQDIGVIFGSVLLRARTRCELTQEELAFRAGVDRTYVSRLERGVRQPTITTLICLAQALGISAADLAQETELEFRRSGNKKSTRERSRSSKAVN